MIKTHATGALAGLASGTSGTRIAPARAGLTKPTAGRIPGETKALFEPDVQIGNRIADYTNMNADGAPSVRTFPSINAAKRESRSLQYAKQGGLGMGCLYVPKGV